MRTAYAEIADQARRVQGVGRNLEDISRALRRVGMADLAEELHGCAEELDAAALEINTAAGRWVDEDLKACQQASANMWNAALAGVKLGAAEKEEMP